MKHAERQSYFARIERIRKRIMDEKSPAYTLKNDDVNYNFKFIGGLMGIPASQVCAVYLMKHVMRALAATRGISHPEGRDGLIADLANYCLILGSLLEEENNG